MPKRINWHRSANGCCIHSRCMNIWVCICVCSVVFQLHWCVQTLIPISLSSVIHWDLSCRWDSPFDLCILWPYCPSLPMRSSSSPNESSDLSYNWLTPVLHQSISCSQVSPSCDLSCQAFFYNRLQSVSITIQFLQPQPPTNIRRLPCWDKRGGLYYLMKKYHATDDWTWYLSLLHTQKRTCEGKWTKHNILSIMECNDNQCQERQLHATRHSWFKSYIWSMQFFQC